MPRYILDRLLTSIPTLLIVSVIVFGILYLLPGDPATLMLAETGASAEAIAKLRGELGLDLPAYQQYFNFVSNMVRGDLGRSIRTNQPVTELIWEQLPSTLELALAAMLVATLLGCSMGILAALRHNTWVDTATMMISMAGISVPIFWSSLMLIFFFSLRLNWFPATGQGGIDRLVLPAVALGLAYTGLTSRLVRSGVLEVLRQDFVRTARAKGLRPATVLFRHVFRNALIPVVTVLGLQIGNLLSGAVIVETIFARQGLGTLTVTAILFKDFRVVQGAVMFIAVIYMISNLLVDISYTFLDPRIRESSNS
jgi:ABC-type dipeptide/oligopeptide/nickel transport system permease component